MKDRPRLEEGDKVPSLNTWLNGLKDSGRGDKETKKSPNNLTPNWRPNSGKP